MRRLLCRLGKHDYGFRQDTINLGRLHLMCRRCRKRKS